MLWSATIAAIAAAPGSYTDKQGRFSVTYPADWTVIDPPASGQIFSAKTPNFPADTQPTTTPTTAPTTRPEADFGTLGITVQEDPQSQSDALTLHDVSAGIVDFVFNHGGQHVHIKPDKVDGLEARRITFENAGKFAVVIVVVKDKTAVVLNATAPVDRFDRYLPVVQGVIDGMKVPAK